MRLFFLVVLANPEDSNTNLLISFGKCALIYGWFLLTTRTSRWMTLFVLALLIALQIAHTRAKLAKDDGRSQDVKLFEFAERAIAGVAVLW
jgi:hypothetical protein